MIVTEEDVLAYLEHHGIKGQKWGVRKQQSSSESSNSGGWSGKKKAAVILGSTALAAGLVAGGIYAKKHFGVKMSDIHGTNETAKKMADSLAKEPLGIVHASRGQNRGFHFLQHYGLDDPLKEFDKGFGGIDRGAGYFKRYGDNLEKVAASFNDPEGRKDAAGRLIPHNVILPKDLAKGVNNSSDAEKVSWPLIKDTFNAMYQKDLRMRR